MTVGGLGARMSTEPNEIVGGANSTVLSCVAHNKVAVECSESLLLLVNVTCASTVVPGSLAVHCTATSAAVPVIDNAGANAHVVAPAHAGSANAKLGSPSICALVTTSGLLGAVPTFAMVRY